MLSCNFDSETGIHYGCIQINSVSQENLSDLESNLPDLVYEGNKKEFLDDLQSFLDDHGIYGFAQRCIVDTADDNYGDSYDNDYRQYRYEKNGYILEWALGGSPDVIMVIKSPYYTFCKPCSPCVPNAGDLDTPDDEKYGIIAYCLPPSFFDKYSPIPYQTIRNVSTHNDAIFEE